MAPGDKFPDFLTNTSLHPSFDEDILNTHLIYDYDAQDSEGKPEKWRYELWCFSNDRVVYAIHGGPMAGRINYQRATYQCIRPGELWQINWLEETGTIVSAVYDIPSKKVTTMIAFSEGHWKRAKEALGDKRKSRIWSGGGNWLRWEIKPVGLCYLSRRMLWRCSKGRGTWCRSRRTTRFSNPHNLIEWTESRRCVWHHTNKYLEGLQTGLYALKKTIMRCTY